MELRILYTLANTTSRDCLRATRTISYVSRTCRNAFHTSPRTRDSKQAIPVGGFYEILLESPFPTSNAAIDGTTTVDASSPAIKESLGKSDAIDPNARRAEVAARAAAVFGTGDTKKFRRAPNTEKSQMINGILVPPRPREPDDEDCCMSGCVNCVWEIFRGELEEYATVKAQAESAGGSKAQTIKTEKDSAIESGSGVSTTSASGARGKMDGDQKTAADGDLYKNIPVGMLEFMKQEKRLKERRIERGLGNVST